MNFIKQAIFFLLIPLAGLGQTAHVDSNRIVYKGIVRVESVNKEELFSRAKNAITRVKGDEEGRVEDDKDKGMIATKGSIRLSSPYHLIKTVEYILELSVDNGKYGYRIDSVYIKQVERGGKTVKLSSQELLKGMDVSGPVSQSTEKQLNEIDMNFQKLIALVSGYMKEASVAKTKD